MLTIENLKYSYKSRNNKSDGDGEKGFDISCDSFFAKRGEVVCFTGEAQCGKTSFSQLVSGVRLPLEGRISIENIDIVKNERLFKKSIGYLSVVNSFYPKITFIEYIRFLNSSYEISEKDLNIKINWFSQFIDIKSILNQRVEDSNSIDIQKIKIFISILNNPKVLILDEPYLNLDKETIDRLNYFLKVLGMDHFVTVLIFLNSNDIDKITGLSQRIVLLSERNILKELLLPAIIRSAEEREITLKQMIDLNFQSSANIALNNDYD